MANIIQLAAYAQDPVTGAGIGGARVRAYPVNADGSRGVSYLETFTAAGTGYWALTVDQSTLTSPTGTYEVEIFDAVSGQTRVIHPAIAMQIQKFVGPYGTAPLDAGSVTESHLADGSATDVKLGSRTLVDTAAPGGNSGTLTALLGFLAYMLKAVTGEVNWRTLPAISLKSLATHATRHQTGGADPLTPADIGAAPAVHSHGGGAGSGTDADFLDGLDSTDFARASHTHLGSQITSQVADADTVDGKHASAFANASHTHPGSAITSQVSDSDQVDGYHAGNSSGRVPVSNGVVNTNLNADLLDGQHAAAFADAGHTHSGYLSTSGGTMTGDLSVRYAGNPGIEIRSTNGGTPYLDFSDDTSSDYDARIVLRNGNTLNVIATGGIQINQTNVPVLRGGGSKIAVQSTPPSDFGPGDLWIDTSVTL